MIGRTHIGRSTAVAVSAIDFNYIINLFINGGGDMEGMGVLSAVADEATQNIPSGQDVN